MEGAAKHDAGDYASHLFIVFNVCAHASSQCSGRVVGPAACPLSRRDTLQGGGRPALTLSDKSVSPFAVPLSKRISLSFNPARSFIHAPAGLWSPPPLTLRLPPPPLHFICILFLGLLISLLFLPPPPLFSIPLYLAPASCSSFSETRLLRGRRGTTTRGCDDNPRPRGGASAGESVPL